MDAVLSSLILSSLDRIQPGVAAQLCRAAGSASAVIDNRRDIRSIAPGCSQRIIDALADIGEARQRAEGEMEYAVRTDVKILCWGGDGYPQRLATCEDAPLVMFFRGSGCLDSRRVVSIVGTRIVSARLSNGWRSCARRRS